MGRRRRPHLPGGLFHVTARTIRYEKLLAPRLRTLALRILSEAVPRSGVRLLAVAIMPNHLHLVVQQGEEPLDALMQPLLRRLALRLQRAHGLEGPIFWRHYRTQFCHDPDYARNAIVYTHLNPVRAGLCADPDGYPWTSHALYDRSASDAPAELMRLAAVLDPGLALPLFAPTSSYPAERLRAEYRAFVQWRLGCADDTAGDAPSVQPTPRSIGPAPSASPPPEALDAVWGGRLSPLFHAPRGRRVDDDRAPALRGRPDMTTVARLTLALEGSDLPLDTLRGRGGGIGRTRLRRAIIRRLHAAGYPNVRIARFLHLSESAVSDAVRRPPPTG